MSDADSTQAFHWTVPKLNQVFAGRLEVESKLGEGAMGAVFRAKQGDRVVALKVLLPAALSSQDTLARFILEGQILKKLDHPNLLKVFEVGEDPQMPYLICEFISGPSLDHLIAREAPFDWKRALDVTGMVLAGLKVAHAENIIHRDIKPSNVLVDEQGVCRLADFGIAKASAMATQKTSTGIVMGTPTYMAPEMVLGGKPTPAADVYSVGTMLFEMLVGQPPFPGEDVTEIFTAKVRGHAPKLSELAEKEMPKPLERLCGMALAREEADRLPSAAAFLQALEDTRRTMQQQKPTSGASGTRAMSVAEIPQDPGSRTRVEGAPPRATQKRKVPSKPVVAAAATPAEVEAAGAMKSVAAGLVVMLALFGAGIAWKNRPPPKKVVTHAAEPVAGLTSAETQLAGDLAIKRALLTTKPDELARVGEDVERSAMILQRAGELATEPSLKAFLWLAAGHTGHPLAVRPLSDVFRLNVAGDSKLAAAKLQLAIVEAKPEVPAGLDRGWVLTQLCLTLTQIANGGQGWNAQVVRAAVRTLGWMADKDTPKDCVENFRVAAGAAAWIDGPGDVPDRQIFAAEQAIGKARDMK